MSVTPQSTAELLADSFQREFILLCGKDGVGKTSAIISLAKFIEAVEPDKRFFVIDTENKFTPTLRSWGVEAPQNIALYRCTNIDEVLEVTELVLKSHNTGDWFASESMDRIWERAQDMGYKAVSGMAKAEYMEKRRQTKPGEKTPPVTPKPDDLWSIVKGAHDGNFLEPLAQSVTLNVLLTTTIGRPPKDRPDRKENQDRKDIRVEFGIDLNLGGAPKLPYYVQTLALLDLNGGRVGCRILRDNCSVLEDARVEWVTGGRKTWGEEFWRICRMGILE